MKKKGKRNLLLLFFTVVLLSLIGSGAALLYTEKERREARTVEIDRVNFNKLHAGEYTGEYAGGMYKWRANKVIVTVTAHKVTAIKLLEHAENQSTASVDELFGRVIQAQSLQVDSISGATLTSKAYLKAIENALHKGVER
ncbi:MULTISPECIES: FMN-binding protein [unclassified Paenibacillus]|uniref:FMN-binding protein n=1 Tax=unclassified Paenibacillus TaxID=185978 RepID=UPI0030FB6337